MAITHLMRVDLEDFPRNNEFNLKSGAVPAFRDGITGKPYAECRNEAQVYELQQLLGLVGPAIAIEPEPEAMPGLTTHGKTVSEIAELVTQIQNRVYLTQLKTLELENPKFPGGRKMVLQIIQERLEEVRNQ